MTSKRLIALVTLCVVAVFLLSVFAQPALAQANTAGGDRSLAEKKGIEGLFQGKGVSADDPRLPTPIQKWAGIGSILVMIIVVKYL